MMTRREMIALSSASAVLALDVAQGGAASALALGQAASAAPNGPFVLPPLPIQPSRASRTSTRRR